MKQVIEILTQVIVFWYTNCFLFRFWNKLQITYAWWSYHIYMYIYWWPMNIPPSTGAWTPVCGHKEQSQKVMNMLPVIVILLWHTFGLLLLRNMIIDLWLSVVNAHPLAHFNSMVGDQVLVTHPDTNPDCSHNFSVWLMSVLFNFSMVYIQ